MGSISPNSPMISPPISPLIVGSSMPFQMAGPPSPVISEPATTAGVPTPTTPLLDQQYYTPSSPTSPGIQDPDANGQINGQYFSSPQNQGPAQGQPRSKTMIMAMKSPTSSSGSGTQPDDDPDFDLYAESNQDPTVTPNHNPNGGQITGQNQKTGGPVPVQGQTQTHFSIQSTSSPPTGTGGHGNGNWGPSGPNHFPSRQSTSAFSGPSTVCRLNGCHKPVFVDPATQHQSEYCSQRHRE